jgi:hypothetical protein
MIKARGMRKEEGARNKREQIRQTRFFHPSALFLDTLLMVELVSLGPPYNFFVSFVLFVVNTSAFGSALAPLRVAANNNSRLKIVVNHLSKIHRDFARNTQLPIIIQNLFQISIFGNKRHMFMRICIKDIDPGQ